MLPDLSYLEYLDSQPFTHIHNLLTLSRTITKQLLDQHTTQVKRGQNQVKYVSWTDDEVELLLGGVRSYSSQKDYEELEWESI